MANAAADTLAVVDLVIPLIGSTSTSWDCEAAGLDVAAGDSLMTVIIGTAE